jgi:hypothetical protein
MTQATPAFTGHFQFNRADYLALTNAMSRSMGRLRLALLLVWMVMIVGMLLLATDDWADFAVAAQDLVTMHNVPVSIYGLLGLFLLLIVFAPQIRRWRAMRMYSWNAIADREIKLEITETGVRVSGPGRDARLDWLLVRKVIVSPEHLFLALSRREAIVLPRRAFAMASDFEAITALALRKVPSALTK